MILIDVLVVLEYLSFPFSVLSITRGACAGGKGQTTHTNTMPTILYETYYIT